MQTTSTALAPLAGLRRIDHVGLTVPSLVQATEFFARVFGAVTLYELAPFVAEARWIAENLGGEARAVTTALVMMRVPNGPTLELSAFDHADRGVATERAKRQPPEQDQVGSAHVGFYVDDIDAGVATLREHDLVVLGAPKRVDSGPNAGLAWVHFLAPWGQQFELVSYPRGIRAYEDAAPGDGGPGAERALPGTAPARIAQIDAGTG